MSMLSTGFRALDNSIVGLIKGKINTILCDTPYARTFFVWNISSQCLKESGLVYYIDLDTIFTSFLEHEAKSTTSLNDLVVFNPDRTDLQDVLAEICSAAFLGPDLVIFDSVTIFSHLFGIEISFGEVNRMLGVCLSLLQNLALAANAAVLVTSLARSKKSKTSDYTLWAPAYPGGRLLVKRSELILELTSGLGCIEVSVVKHPNLSLHGCVCRLPTHKT